MKKNLHRKLVAVKLSAMNTTINQAQPQTAGANPPASPTRHYRYFEWQTQFTDGSGRWSRHTSSKQIDGSDAEALITFKDAIKTQRLSDLESDRILTSFVGLPSSRSMKHRIVLVEKTCTTVEGDFKP